MEGVDGMEIGPSPVLRMAAWQSHSRLAWPLIWASSSFVAPLYLICPSVIDYLHFFRSAFPFFPRSLSRLLSPYSVHLCTVTAADSPSSWVRSPPPQMTSLCWRAPGPHAATDGHISLWNETDPYLYHSRHGNQWERFWEKRTLGTEDLSVTKVFWTEHQPVFQTAVTAVVSCSWSSKPWDYTGLHHEVPK